VTIVYGDFNCPYSYLASLRVDALLATGGDVEWRAVEHAPTLPVIGRRLDDAGKAEMDAEVQAIRELLMSEEELPFVTPQLVPRTEAAVAGYAEACGAGVADEVRRILFDAYWTRGLNIGSPEVLRPMLAGPIRGGQATALPLHRSGYAVSAARGPITVAAHRLIRGWQTGWEETGTQTTPTVIARGVAFAGIDGLAWLAEELTHRLTQADPPGPDAHNSSTRQDTPPATAAA
jgi:hypothetical protein